MPIIRILLHYRDGVLNFSDVLGKVRALRPEQKQLISIVVQICKLILINPATTAAAERTFPLARRICMCLRSYMKQTRFNNLTMLHCHKAWTDVIDIVAVANEFIASENRSRHFGKFTIDDLKFEQPFCLQVPDLHSSLLTFSKCIFYLHLVLLDNAVIFFYRCSLSCSGGKRYFSLYILSYALCGILRISILEMQFKIQFLPLHYLHLKFSSIKVNTDIQKSWSCPHLWEKPFQLRPGPRSHQELRASPGPCC